MAGKVSGVLMPRAADPSGSGATTDCGRRHHVFDVALSRIKHRASWEILWFWETPQAAFDRYSLWVFNRANTTRAIFLASMTKA